MILCAQPRIAWCDGIITNGTKAYLLRTQPNACCIGETRGTWFGKMFALLRTHCEGRHLGTAASLSKPTIQTRATNTKPEEGWCAEYEAGRRLVRSSVDSFMRRGGMCINSIDFSSKYTHQQQLQSSLKPHQPSNPRSQRSFFQTTVTFFAYNLSKLHQSYPSKCSRPSSSLLWLPPPSLLLQAEAGAKPPPAPPNTAPHPASTKKLRPGTRPRPTGKHPQPGPKANMK